MAQFQLGDVPHGFAYNADGSLIHYKHVILLAAPAANQSGVWGDSWLSFGSDWADVKLRVAVHDGSAWVWVKHIDVVAANGRIAQQLPASAQKISIGREKKSASDFVDNAPVGCLLELL
ncbi:hypothetical protein [Streptomyces niveus]|uniref:Uncharacterized protein n=1 Tax=Streptomyces niveus TaxID=193462 RepID=A0A1U9R1X4_STRNV|nr:hypothetical protein [Streptomyces niveus]AQU70091.1 hypothetical protein BBN63_31855 [Streptomyces niveus]